MIIEKLALHRDWINVLAHAHFDQWGPLTGSATVEEYIGFLGETAECSKILSVFVASLSGLLVGSGTLRRCDMEVRKGLTPWLGQLFVFPIYRRHGTGAALVRAVAAEARSVGYDTLYLYTSGQLPTFYKRLGWSLRERVEYLGKERTVMQYNLLPNMGFYG